MTTRGQVDRAIGELGELVHAHEGDADLSEYEGHETAVSFTREVLAETDPGPWSDQREVMELVAYNDRVAWRGAQGVGKDWTAARIALWWTYARGGLTLISGPTARQVTEIIMRRELARAFRRSNLPGTLYTNSLRVRDEAASVLAMTSTQASGLTGFHDARVLVILTEAQAVERAGWEGLLACTTGAEDKLLAIGNPLEPVGTFFDVSRPDSGWRTMQTAATDHPNVTGETFVPGGPSEDWFERMDDMWGEGSPMWVARVEGEFPTDSVEGLYSFADVEAAIARGKDTAFTARHANAEPVVGLDVARKGLDSSVAAVMRGPVVEELHVWSGASTTETVETVKRIAHEAGVRKDQLSGLPVGLRLELREAGEGVEVGRIQVDEIAVGGGPYDQLKDDGWPVRGFKASRKAKDSERFANRRAEAHWALRELLAAGEIALPDDRELREELLAVDWSPDGKGRVQIESKDAIKSKLGRSPDRLDAVVIAAAERVRGGPPKQHIVQFSPG